MRRPESASLITALAPLLMALLLWQARAGQAVRVDACRLLGVALVGRRFS